MSHAAAILLGRSLWLMDGQSMDYKPFTDANRLDLIGASPICEIASDAVTRAAHDVGYVASRELHAIGPLEIPFHSLTSFSPLDKPLGDDDIILCATWGQFAPKEFNKRYGKTGNLYGFFAKRKDIKRRVGSSIYDRYFSAESAALRQTAHAPLPQEVQKAAMINHPAHTWLKTTPDDILAGRYAATEVPIGAYPSSMWDRGHLLQNAAALGVTPAN